MTQRPFAHKGTQTKLRTVADYLAFYTKALSGRFQLTYFDAFAGTGEIPHGDLLPLLSDSVEMESVVEGSAVRALKVKPPFDRFMFVESKQGNIAGLESLKSQFPHLAKRINVVREDANVAIQRFCREQFTSRDRAVMFLDPFGNQLKWDSILAIAQTPGIDLWYLFPSGLGVVRQMSEDGQLQKDAERSINDLFGTKEWYSALTIKEEAGDLFNSTRETTRKIATADAVTRYMIARMKEVFKGGVLDQWLPLGKRGGHWHSLIFAWTNSSERATDLARRVATEIMRKK